MSAAVDRTTGESLWKPDDKVWVRAYSAWRRGFVTHPLPSGAWVNYSCSATTGARRESRFSDAEGRILKGSLPPPIVTSCPECKRKIVDGRPGEDEESVIARHYGRSHAPAPVEFVETLQANATQIVASYGIVPPVLVGCGGCRCCPAGACDPGQPLGPGICGHDCPCHPDFSEEDGTDD